MKIRFAEVCLRSVIAASAVLILARNAAALEAESFTNEFTLGIGYSHLSIGGDDSVLSSLDLLKFDGVFSINPIEPVPQLRIGFALGVGADLEDTKYVIHSSGGLNAFVSSDVPLWVLEPELRLSWQQWLGNLYIEPGIGVGGVFANLNLEPETIGGPSIDEWDSSFSTRAFVNIGIPVAGGTAGVQASYMWAEEIRFADNAGGEVTEAYIGIFGSLQF